MRQYIVNLTNNLIGEHRFDLVIGRPDVDEPDFLRQAATTLLTQNISRMSPETLGRILCELDGADITPVAHLAHFKFAANENCGRSIRILVSGLLAQVIYNRLSGRIPCGYSRQGTVSPGFAKTVGEFVRRRQDYLNGLRSGSSMLKITYRGKQLTCVYLRHDQDTVTIRTTREDINHTFKNGEIRLSGGSLTIVDVKFRLNEIQIANG